ncbi:hypothetical protein DDE19_10740 [Micromonospora ureilytica]|uniref:Uncharacterized protein n=1 Tax=Micromonospora ureilytica TaxID=709868 RepID=A0A3N9XWZ1_9ACTN|nr:hypothetical protein [Micromonospora ureilytica]MBG6063775.1 hypothetical protein [Micromonospora ureilytica]RQX17631.1 hypothetical protein DDE19_10740 [Micromonospora ureilytica]
MSAIASLTLVPRDSITELARLARTSPSSFHTYLAEHGGKTRQEYDWSGYCMLYVLTYLEERGIDLEQPELNAESEAINSAYGLTTLVAPARRLVDQLDPSAHREDELVAHFEEMGVAFEESGAAGLDTLRLLRDTISELRDDQILLINIG